MDIIIMWILSYSMKFRSDIHVSLLQYTKIQKQIPSLSYFQIFSFRQPEFYWNWSSKQKRRIEKVRSKKLF